ncbi:MAG: hypothetical protein ACTHML_00610 [Ginsengibacter sp.]
MNTRKDFFIKEYDKLSAEIAELLKEIHAREKFSLVIFAATSVFVLTKTGNQPFLVKEIICLVPIVCTIIYGLSVLYLYKNIGFMGQYLEKIEEEFLQKPGAIGFEFGWEKFFDKCVITRKESKAKIKGENKSKLVNVTMIFWIGQLIAGIALMILVNYFDFTVTSTT